MADKQQKRSTTKTNSAQKKSSRRRAVPQKVRRQATALSERRKEFLGRRPHRSLKRTKRRDYRRSLKLPGYWALTAQVWSVIARNKKIFLGLAFLYAIFTLLLSSIMSQDTYLQIQDVVDESQEAGLISGAMSQLALFWGVVSSQLSGNATVAGSSQQIFGTLLGLYTWLAAVWLLRGVMAGKKPRLRDGLYSSGGSVLALGVLLFIVLIQLLPAAIALIAYGAADTSGLLDQTAVLMLFGGAAILLCVLSLYWITSTLFAMVIVTLPGMYPMQALKLAGDIVIGRRIRILLRMCWAAVLLFIVWAVVLLPVIIIDGALKSSIPDLSWLPVVPVVALLLAAFSIVFMACYTYVFYRKVVEDDAAPA